MNITQVANQFGLTAATLRYYERIGLIPPINRRNNGIRDYSQEDIYWIEFIKCMRDAGITIESLIEYTALFSEGDETLKARKEILVSERTKLIERREEINQIIKRLDVKINDCDGNMTEIEAELKNIPIVE
ncbi:MerR family transcriptional regulator [Paenibacillus sp. HN-1]|uniref:MerR family transcriptional regulator n=1 Tax=Paenibacillus TaxID=44249 RepID=UPI001CA7D33E|nr:MULTISPECIES: MerR family transcriptional regulator [Paenibacillus]MBY9078132.1 MerR family transcriptional regulator [Paenibacillus sp. CGMCC 1.18879]MBY9083873.1 MerR family transcriptional regulator [Paenibacillus sinensis]